MRLSYAGILLAAGSLLVGAGCGRSDDVVFAPVRGTVLLKGQPLAEAMIVLHPQEAVAAGEKANQQPGAVLPRPVAYSDEAGRFAITSLQAGDGAPPGQYSITVELRESRLVGEEMVRDGRNVLPAKYASPRTTPLKFQVLAGENEVPAIEIE